jgi:hypothetical protein
VTWISSERVFVVARVESRREVRWDPAASDFVTARVDLGPWDFVAAPTPSRSSRRPVRVAPAPTVTWGIKRREAPPFPLPECADAFCLAGERRCLSDDCTAFDIDLDGDGDLDIVTMDVSWPAGNMDMLAGRQVNASQTRGWVVTQDGGEWGERRDIGTSDGLSGLVDSVGVRADDDAARRGDICVRLLDAGHEGASGKRVVACYRLAPRAPTAEKTPAYRRVPVGEARYCVEDGELRLEEMPVVGEVPAGASRRPASLVAGQ